MLEQEITRDKSRDERIEKQERNPIKDPGEKQDADFCDITHLEQRIKEEIDYSRWSHEFLDKMDPGEINKEAAIMLKSIHLVGKHRNSRGMINGIVEIRSRFRVIYTRYVYFCLV